MPIVEVVARFKAGFGEVGHLVAPIAAGGEVFARRLVLVGDGVGVRQVAVQIVAVHGRAVFGRQRVHGDVAGAAALCKVDGAQNVLRRLPLEPDHHVGALVGVAEQGAGVFKIFRRVDPADLFQQGVVCRLQAHGKAVDARLFIRLYPGGVYRAGVELDGDFRFFGKAEAGADLIHAARYPLRVDHGGRAAAEIDGIEGLALQVFGAELHLFEHAGHIGVGKAEFCGIRHEVAVPALRSAKGYMDIDARHVPSYKQSNVCAMCARHSTAQIGDFLVLCGKNCDIHAA